MQIFWLELSKLNKEDFVRKMKAAEVKSMIFAETLRKWDYLIPDGIGLYAGFQIIDSKLPKFLKLLLIPYYWLNLFLKRKKLYTEYGDRICWSDLTKELIEHANDKWLGVTIVDKFQAPWNAWDNLKIERQKITKSLLEKKYPNARFHYYIYRKDEEEKIIEAINSTDDIYLFSSQWLKDQENTICSMMPKLTNIKVAVWIGGSFDMILWFKKRAPKIVISLWLEWLWRLIINPQRMLKRIWKALFVFLWEVTKSS